MEGEAQVYDLDTALDFPCQFDDYMGKAVGSDDGILPDYQRFVAISNP